MESGVFQPFYRGKGVQKVETGSWYEFLLFTWYFIPCHNQLLLLLSKLQQNLPHPLSGGRCVWFGLVVCFVADLCVIVIILLLPKFRQGDVWLGYLVLSKNTQGRTEGHGSRYQSALVLAGLMIDLSSDSRAGTPWQLQRNIWPAAEEALALLHACFLNIATT